ncbi:Uncharacterised protein [uncultured archaeon]|nr:Uncharacterised protein [uncultured archaeon]
MEDRKHISIFQSCMDCRMNKRILDMIDKGELKQDDVIVRGAGLISQLRHNTYRFLMDKYVIDKVINRPHTDCGAMKTIMDNKKNGIWPGDENLAELSRPFNSMSFRDSDELERFNDLYQKALTQNCFGLGTAVESEMVEFHEQPSKHKHVLIVSNPISVHDYYGLFDAVGESIGDCYCVHKVKEDSASIDLSIKRLNICNIVFVALPDEKIGVAAKRMERAKGKISAEYDDQIKVNLHSMKIKSA